MELRVDLIRKLYVKYDIPSDRLATNPEVLVRFTQEYHKKSGDIDMGYGQMGRTLINLRKSGKLPRLRKNVEVVT
jgi:hypothetical protein